jgi:hypothetical protein
MFCFEMTRQVMNIHAVNWAENVVDEQAVLYVLYFAMLDKYSLFS